MAMRGGTHVEDDDRVRGLEVDAEAAGARREQERKVGRAGRVEVRDALLARLGRDGAVEPLVLVPAQGHVVAHDVEHAHHLAEDDAGGVVAA